jgi:CheY-like chemotaxis protein
LQEINGFETESLDPTLYQSLIDVAASVAHPSLMERYMDRPATASQPDHLASVGVSGRLVSPPARFVRFSLSMWGRQVRQEPWWHLNSRCIQYAEGSGKTMTGQRPLVSVVDDDASVRESLPDLLRAFGFAARVFSSAEEFLESGYVEKTRCLILDVAMPGMTGPDLQTELKNRGREIPIVFITALGDQTIRRRLLENGAVECLFKPFSHTALREALNAALRKD